MTESCEGAKCKSIVSLNIRRTRVTGIGARHAIENLPALEHLNYEESIQVVARMSREGVALPNQQDQSPLQRDAARSLLPLTHLDYRSTEFSIRPISSKFPYASGDLKAAIQLCPFVVHVHLDAEDESFSDRDLLALLNLANLQHFSLAVGNERITFSGGVEPILQKFGPKSLDFLALQSLEGVDVGGIVQLCPKLCSLILFEIDWRHKRNKVKSSAHQHLLPHLEHLDVLLDGFNSGTPTSWDLSFLLASCPSLLTLKLIGLEGLNDQVIQAAALSEGFAHLKELTIVSCPNVTSSSIDHLLTLGGPLNSLHVCPHFSGMHVANWRYLAKKSNWDLIIRQDRDLLSD